MAVESIKYQYQKQGHEQCDLNPLADASLKKEITPVSTVPLERPVAVGHFTAEDGASLRALLERVYCTGMGFEIAHLPSAEMAWMADKIETVCTMNTSAAMRERIATTLVTAEAFEAFMQKRFSQVKRYGFEGCESVAVALDILLQAVTDVDHVMIAMPHRGRLALMVDQMNYPPEALFHKLEGHSELPASVPGSADVLSHLYLQRSVAIGGRPGKVTLLPNPSHLEAGNPVGLGAAYAYQKYQEPGKQCLSIQFHGDAAFSGQGVVTESLALSQLPNFGVGGSIHIIVNNQLGFTTTAQHGRSSRYASDPAKIIGAPVIHVNADCPEEVTKAMVLAVEYQKTFKKDVVVDVIGWRKMGHNELDEPAFTQPLMYRRINGRSSIARKYAEGILPVDQIAKTEQAQFERLDRSLKAAKDYVPEQIPMQDTWGLVYQPESKKHDVATGSEPDRLTAALKQSIRVPDGFNIHPRLQKHHVEPRLSMLAADKKTPVIDWATAEAMAVGTLLLEGHNVRLCGQDVGRGTFSHRHFVLVDQQTDQPVVPLNDAVEAGRGRLEVVPSNLSEFAVLGFEYGVSVAAERVLPIWEAQFGDFANGAQIVIDNFIASGEAKWGFQSNLTLLLPHGYDGAGPEHSSCRIERFLQGCNTPFEAREYDSNMIVANPTTPANYFHLLRRQMLRNYRKPLVIASPKVLLRLPAAVSALQDFLSDTRFQPVIVDKTADLKRVKEVVFVSGKLYYELKKEASAMALQDAYLFVRVEELAPFPFAEIKRTVGEIMTVARNARFTWCQEEHQNMGAFAYVAPRLESLLSSKLRYVGRGPAAASATGIAKVHKAEHAQLLQDLFASGKS